MTDIDADLLELADGPNSHDHDKPWYPLEGKYIDEEDRERILGLSELEREAILGERAEQQAEQQQRQHLRRLVHEREARHAPTAQSERARKLEELRQRRTKTPAKPKPKRKYSYDDDDDEEEDVYEEEDDIAADASYASEAESEDYAATPKKKADPAAKEPASPQDLQRICVTRKQIAQILRAPWLKEWITGTYVRYLVGVADGQRAYRVCEVIGLEPSRHAYRVEGVKVQINVVLKHGRSERAFPMENISNTPFEPREFARLAQTLSADGLALPTRGAVDAKAAYLASHSQYLLTEADVASLIASRKKESIVERKSRLILAREQAATQRDSLAWTKANDELRALLGAADAAVASTDDAPGTTAPKPHDVVARINERNRLLNAGAARRKAPRLDMPAPSALPALPPLDLTSVPVLDQGLLRKALLADRAGLFEYHAAQNVGLSLPADF